MKNWNEKRCSKSNILTRGHELGLENSSSAAVYKLQNTIVYLKVVKYLNIRLRQIYYTELEIKIWMQKIEGRVLYYDSKDSGQVLEIKNLVAVVLILLGHNSLCGQAISSSQLQQVDNTSGQKQLTIFKIRGPRWNSELW